METVTVKTDIFEFHELSDSAKQKVLQWYCTDLDGYWEAQVLEDAKTIGALMGFDIENIYYSGFYCQGDGACFTGSIWYKKHALKNVMEYAPKDNELHRIAREWQNLQKRNFYALRASVKHRGHYMHEMCTSFDCEDTRHNYGWLRDAAIEADIAEIARDFMRWIYRQLESAYDYETSEENIAGMCQANEWRFTEDGTFFRA